MPATPRVPPAPSGFARARSDRPRPRRRVAAIAALTFCLAGIYVAGAFQHAGRMNLIKRRGDQSSYLQYAKDLHANWHGQQPPILGDRNRMPLYPAYQALFYSRAITDDEFFERGKAASILLSVVLLFVVAAVAATMLPPLTALTLTAVAAFTCFIFKAGYVQADLMYYTLHFATFVATCRLLTMQTGRALLATAGLVGVLAALSHLTKAASVPGVVLAVASLLARALSEATGRTRLLVHAALWRAGAAALLVAIFLLVLSPYITTSKRVFGAYFYNVNSTFYMWYDEWGDAIKGTRAHGDRQGWPQMPPEQLPGPARYWREHSLAEIGQRLAGGFRQMAVDLWSGFWAFKFAVLAAVGAALVVWPHRAVLPVLLRAQGPLVGFVGAYFAVYLLLAAFYAPVSGTGVARFALAHFLPFLFVAGAVWSHRAFDRTDPDAGVSWNRRPEWFILATLALDVPFGIWPRLLTTYGGY